MSTTTEAKRANHGAASLFGIFVIPMLYVVFQWLREWAAPQASRPEASAKVRS